MNTCTTTIDIALGEIEAGPSIEDVVADDELIPEFEALEARLIARFLSTRVITAPRPPRRMAVQTAIRNTPTFV